jgi:glutamate--cysteine ligase
MRGADAGSQAMMNALPAFWVGLTYDNGALDAAWDIVKGWTAETRETLRVAASERALAAEAGGIRMADLAAQVLSLSEAGLKARGMGEEVFITPLSEEIATGKTRADRLLDLYHGEWAGDLSRVYDETRL